MTSILDNIVAAKQEDLVRAQQMRPIRRLREALPTAPPVRDFFAALSGKGPVKLIAEVKKASPSKGVIRKDFDPGQIARIYQQHGAACISVLTDFPFFQGRLEYLTEIRQQVDLPLLRKDFILDEYQLLEARVAGADAVLLIAECLTDQQLKQLHAQSLQLGMTPLVEFYEPGNLARVLDAGARLIGVNNRDLKTFRTDLQHTVRMRQQIPDGCLVVGESGIHSRADVELLESAGVDAMLVGEHLMASSPIGQAIDRLLGRDKTRDTDETGAADKNADAVFLD